MSVRGSKLLAQWLKSPKVNVLERINDGPRQKDALIVFKMIATGAVFVVVPFKHRDGFRSGKRTISEARKGQVETWGANAHLLGKTRTHSPTHVICFLTDVEEFFVSPFEAWFDPAIRKTRTAKTSRKELVHVPTHHMTHFPSKKDLRAE